MSSTNIYAHIIFFRTKVKSHLNFIRYLKLIAVAKSNEIPENEYTESHHIIPKSMGGTNDKSNIVKLTARLHFLAHLMLFRAFRCKNTCFALKMFLDKCANQNQSNRKTINSKSFASFRKDHSNFLRIRQTGKKQSIETIQKRVNKNKGKKYI
jgi:hypothetical protein